MESISPDSINASEQCFEKLSSQSLPYWSTLVSLNNLYPKDESVYVQAIEKVIELYVQ